MTEPKESPHTVDAVEGLLEGFWQALLDGGSQSTPWASCKPVRRRNGIPGVYAVNRLTPVL